MKRRYSASECSGDKPVSGYEPHRVQRLQFMPYPFSKYTGQFPYFRQPKEIGSFSQDHERHFQNDRSQLKFYCPPSDLHSCEFDLQAGYDNFIRRDENVKEYLNDLLRWIQTHRDSFAIPNAVSNKYIYYIFK